MPINGEVKCKISNLMYLLTCKSCKIQYTGETVQQLNERMQKHRGSIGCLNKENGAIQGNKLMAYHFSKEICQISGFFIQIIVKLNGDGRLQNRKVDLEVTKQHQSY